jgi:transcriptional regulator with XRE-family HTH domain
MNLGDRIQQLRKGIGLSQEQLAEIIGVSRQAISKWETDQSSPDLDKIVLLCNTFSVSADELLGTRDDNSKDTVQIESYIRTNLLKRLLSIGWISSLTGVILLIVEFISLYFIKNMEIQSAISRGAGYRPDTWYYASQFPMSVIIIITIIVIVIGVAISIYSLKQQNKSAN